MEATDEAWKYWHPDDTPPDDWDRDPSEWVRLFWNGFWECVFGHDSRSLYLDYGYVPSSIAVLRGIRFPKAWAYGAGWDEGCGMYWDHNARDKARASWVAKGGNKYWEHHEQRDR